MRRILTSLVTLAAVSLPASSQITSTITREPIARTTLTRLVLLSPASPATGRRGQQNLTVQLTGLNTHFAQGITTLSMGAGITIVSPVTVVSPTSASAVISIDAATTAGARAITMTSGTEVVSIGEGFSVTELPDSFAKTCAIAGSLGTMSKGMTRAVYGLIDMPGVEDWFLVSIPAGTSLKLSLSGVGPGSEMEVSAQSSCGGTLIASTTTGVTPKQIVIPPSPYQNFLIRVRASQWRAESSRFTLSLVAE